MGWNLSSRVSRILPAPLSRDNYLSTVTVRASVHSNRLGRVFPAGAQSAPCGAPWLPLSGPRFDVTGGRGEPASRVAEGRRRTQVSGLGALGGRAVVSICLGVLVASPSLRRQPWTARGIHSVSHLLLQSVACVLSPSDAFSVQVTKETKGKTLT